MADELTNDEREELIRCATNRNMMVRLVSRIRQPVLRMLARKGYLRMANPKDTYNAGSASATVAGNAPLTLTEKGKAYILMLKPADFQKETWFPLPSDIREARKRAAESR